MVTPKSDKNIAFIRKDKKNNKEGGKNEFWFQN
jgi:hypothetical protein